MTHQCKDFQLVNFPSGADPPRDPDDDEDEDKKDEDRNKDLDPAVIREPDE